MEAKLRLHATPATLVTLGVFLALLVLIVALGAAAAPAYGGAFPGANGEIAFARGAGGGANLYAVEPDGTGLTQLTNGGSDASPAFSPDGTRITFARSGNIYVADADGSNLRQLTSSGTDRNPSFSPRGNSIVFSRIIQSSPIKDVYAIFVMDDDGTNVEQLSHPPSNPNETAGPSDVEPVYSPEDPYIAFARGDFEQPVFVEPQIYIMDIDGSNPTQVTNSTVAQDPSFSPDGQQIAFAAQQAGNTDIFVIDRQGTNLRRVTSDPADDDQPAFSPDGRRIAFRRQFSIYTVAIDGTDERQLTSNNTDSQPDWQPLFGLGGVPVCHHQPATVVGTWHSDRLGGTPGHDVIAALGGRDRINSNGGRDLVCAGRGHDVLRGGKGRDRLLGRRGSDRISGQSGADLLYGRRGGDSLRGGQGPDRLVGGKGRDRCEGGSSADVVLGC